MSAAERVLKHAERVYVQSGCIDFVTVRDTARALGMTQRAVLDAAEDLQDHGRAMVNTGLAACGGIMSFGRIGDYQIEAWTDEADRTWRAAIGIPPEFDRGITDAFA